MDGYKKAAWSWSCIFFLVILLLPAESLRAASKSLPVKGVYHRVKGGENLKRIAQAYQIPMQVLIDANHIADPDRLEAGSVLFIPHAKRVIEDIVPERPLKPEPEKRGDGSAGIPVKKPEGPSVKKNEDVRGRSSPDKVVERQGERKKDDPRLLLEDGVPAKPLQDRTQPLKPEGQGADQEKKAENQKKKAFGEEIKGHLDEPKQPKEPVKKVMEERPGASPRAEQKFAAKEREKPPADTKGFIWPVRGKVVSRFGKQPNGMHYNGIKIVAKEGKPIVAAAKGTVIFSASLKDYGETIIVKHEHHYATVYTHLHERLVKADTQIRQGAKIGLPGKADKKGEYFLNFEVRHHNKAINPLQILH